jgi:hypothetical protein
VIRALLLLLIITTPSLSVAEGDYRLFTGNGINTNLRDMIENMEATRRLVGKSFDGRTIHYAAAKNPTPEALGNYSVLVDLLEAAEQWLNDSGSTEISWSDFVGLKLLWAFKNDVWGSFPTDTNAQVVNDHVFRYKRLIENNGDSVLIVPHSQGNWYALAARDRVVEELASIDGIEDRITAFHVASPANRVVDQAISQDHPDRDNYYLTNDADGITLVPGSWPANASIVSSNIQDSRRWWDPGWLLSNFPILQNIPVIGPQLNGGADAFAKLNGHSYQRAYAHPNVNISRQLKTGIDASLKRLQFPDIVPPEITLLGENPLSITVGTDYVEPGANATDDIDGVVSVSVDATAVDATTEGSYPVLYSAEDQAGNQANATRVVNVGSIAGLNRYCRLDASLSSGTYNRQPPPDRSNIVPNTDVSFPPRVAWAIASGSVEIDSEIGCDRTSQLQIVWLDYQFTDEIYAMSRPLETGSIIGGGTVTAPNACGFEDDVSEIRETPSFQWYSC